MSSNTIVTALAETQFGRARLGAWSARRTRALLLLILLVSGGAITLAMRRTSTTFDETILVAGGARGYQSGDWSLAPEHPPLTQYLYGLLPHLTGPKYPDEGVFGKERYRYSSAFFFGVGNDPERMAFLGRLPAVACALLLVVVVFYTTRRRFGDPAALLAAAMVAFLPDVLAHGGVAYNDVPVALAIFSALYLADAAIRQPTIWKGAAFGIVAGLALGTKNSAITIAPIALLLLTEEAVVRRAEREWAVRISLAAAAALLGTYLALVATYRGDFTLHEYRYAIGFVLGQVTEAKMPGYLLGTTTRGGRWSYFPIAFLFKTSAGFHILLALAALYFGSRVREPGLLQRMLSSPLRVPFTALLVLVPVLLTSELNLGFRYALPALPMLAVLAAVGVARLWRSTTRSLRMVIIAATACLIIHPLSYYPNFLTYISEYGPGRDRNYTVLADASMDWGQGLIQLRDFMREHNIPRVYLSYYGTAWPAGYGIDYVPVLSFFGLPRLAPSQAPPPRYIVISATNLVGARYFGGTDPYRQYREHDPDYVVGNTMFIYSVR